MQRRPTAANIRRLILHRVAECLYRSDSGIYYAVLTVKGKQVRKSLRTDDKGLARKKLSDLRRLVCRLSPAALTFEQLTEQYLVFIGTRGMKPKSFQRRVVSVRSLVSYFGGKAIRSINRMNVERWAASRTQDCSPRSYNIDLETLKQVFNYAVEHGLVVESPAAGIRRQKQKAALVIIPSREQFRVLIADLRLGNFSKDTADFVEFLAYSGCRQGEAAEIRWGEVDFQKKTMTISGGDRGTKSGLARTIPLFAPLERLLLSIRASRHEQPKLTDRIIGCLRAGLHGKLGRGRAG